MAYTPIAIAVCQFGISACPHDQHAYPLSHLWSLRDFPARGVQHPDASPAVCFLTIYRLRLAVYSGHRG